ncbi:MAG: hypothetical protein IPH88_07940 [Bacteroidales bacterium]|nr:hypothetical protein [Bacteroidales bacterium]
MFNPTETCAQYSQKNDSAKYARFIPDYVKLQFAGGIGLLSAGVGYSFFKEKLEVSYFYGYVPKSVSIDDLHSVSLQVTAKFWRFKVNPGIEIVPLNVGWFIHHTFGNEYWITLPSHYPAEYYWWSPGRNSGIFLGGEIKTKLLSNKTPASGTAFYARLGTRGLYVTSKIGNSSIPFRDIVEFGFGVAFYR